MMGLDGHQVKARALLRRGKQESSDIKECSYCTDVARASPSHYTQYTVTIIDIYGRSEMSNEEYNALTVDVEVLPGCDDSKLGQC
ncbi:unnamed protein product [Hydatigera taeniaeformis]|uniref:Ras-associating domain-containing protein n=1 Tax=Hydatigena taeniaeformis TaxID=6205 RepID=A0A0R3WXI4_HYDTA|nr:unnamed protein product [Hydatigera taeniaeformis]